MSNDPYDPRTNPVPSEHEALHPAVPDYDDFRRGSLRGVSDVDPAQPIGALQSATIKTLIVGLIVVLATFGVKLAWTDAQVQAVADAVIALATVVSTVGGIVFRIRATRKVIVGAKATDRSVTTPTVAALLGSLVAFGAAGGFAGGCAALFPPSSTPVSRVYAIKYARTQAVLEVSAAVNAGMFDARPDVLRAIPPARAAIDDALAAALRMAQDPAQKSSALFWIEAADKALQHYVELTGSKNRTLPTTVPTTRPDDVVELRRRAAA